MKHILYSIISFLCLLSLFACKSPKDVVYLQDVVPLKQSEIEQRFEVYIHEDDLLAIMVNSKDPELALPFNMPMVTYQVGYQNTAPRLVYDRGRPHYAPRSPQYGRRPDHLRTTGSRGGDSRERRAADGPLPRPPFVGYLLFPLLLFATERHCLCGTEPHESTAQRHQPEQFDERMALRLLGVGLDCLGDCYGGVE